MKNAVCKNSRTRGMFRFYGANRTKVILFILKMQKSDAVTKNTSVCSGFGKKVASRVRMRVSLEVCVEIWRICHADRDRKHAACLKNSLVRVMEDVVFIFVPGEPHWVYLS